MEDAYLYPSFSNLPLEVVAHIFLFLPFSTLQRARLICKQWYEASLDHRLLNKEKLVIDARFCDQNSMISQIKECSRHFLHLNIVGKSSVCLDEEFWFKLGPRLKSLCLVMCSMREVDLFHILNYCPKLKCLEVTHLEILTSCDWHLSLENLSDMNNFQYLKITGYDFPHSNFKLFSWAGAKAPNLKKIFFVDCLADSQANLSQGLTCEHILSYLKNKSHCMFDLGFDVSQEYMYDDELVKLASQPNVRLRILNTNFFPRPIYSTCQLWVQVLVLKAILPLDESMFESICTNFPNLRSLTVDDISDIKTAVHKLSLLKNLTFLSLTTEYGYVEESDLFTGLCSEVNTTLRNFHLHVANEMSSVFYIEFARTHPALTTFSVSASQSIDDWTIQAFFKYLVFLECLCIREANAVDVGWLGAAISRPLNKEEKENPTGFGISRLKGLRMLDISRSRIDVKTLELVIVNLPTIEVLRIEQLPISDDFLELIGEKLPCLTEVYLFGCRKVTMTGIKCLGLSRFRIKVSR